MNYKHLEQMNYNQLKSYLENLNVRTTGLFTKKELLDKYYSLLHQYDKSYIKLIV